MTLHEYQRSGSIIDVHPRSLRFTFSNFFSLEIFRPIEANFMCSLHGIGEWKFVQMVYVTWPVWPPCPSMVKTFRNLLPWNQKANDLERWYAASGTRVLPNLFKWWPWVDPRPILRQGQIWSIMLLYGKKVKLELSEDPDYSPAIVLSEEKDISWTEN